MRPLRGSVWGCALVALVAGVGSAQALRLPSAANCPIFPANNPWNERVDNLPVAANSAQLPNRLAGSLAIAAADTPRQTISWGSISESSCWNQGRHRSAVAFASRKLTLPSCIRYRSIAASSSQHFSFRLRFRWRRFSYHFF